MQIKSSSAAYSEWTVFSRSERTSQAQSRKGPLSVSEPGRQRLCPQAVRGAHPTPTLAFPLSPAGTPLPAIPTSKISLAKWHHFGNTPPIAQRWNNFNFQKCDRTFRSAWNQLPKLWNSCCATASEHTVKVPLQRGDDLTTILLGIGLAISLSATCTQSQACTGQASPWSSAAPGTGDRTLETPSSLPPPL